MPARADSGIGSLIGADAGFVAFGVMEGGPEVAELCLGVADDGGAEGGEAVELGGEGYPSPRVQVDVAAVPGSLRFDQKGPTKNCSPDWWPVGHGRERRDPRRSRPVNLRLRI